MTRPVAATIAPHTAAASRSEIDRPTRIAVGDIGSVRRRLMTPVLRSVLRPTAVPIAEVVRFMASRPARTNCL